MTAALTTALTTALDCSPVAALLGPRQCGKTTLARMIGDRLSATVFDLEDPIDRARLEHPLQALGNLEGLVILDEIQRQPELFELLRVLVDRPDNSARFLVLGSASPDLVKGSSESLAGRVSFVDLHGFDLDEVGSDQLQQLWVRGGLPRSFLADTEADSVQWRDDFVRTFLERDLPQLGITVPAETLRRFWTMVAHYHGQTWNGAEFARSLGTGEAAARRYLDILAGAYMVRILPPWHENLRKRQVKSPKVYLRDSGLLHALLRLDGFDQLQGHPKLGASWEGFALEETLRITATRDAYFWATHGGAELDLLVLAGGKRHGFEFKYADAPRRGRSMLIALEDLDLDILRVVYPGDRSYDLHDKIRVIPLAGLREDWEG
jgi:predicted AAA+ superfamily ATPase